jgi:hypothetical protein
MLPQTEYALVALARRKAPIRPDEPVELYRLEVMRYH